jgi:TPR repeat protein
MLLDGRGVDANPVHARVWIMCAAQGGWLDAQVLLAHMMMTGQGGAKDHPAALALFENAAKRGHVGAMHAAGAMTDGGYEVPIDPAAAQRWFRAAAERGHPRAQMMLGRYLGRGLAGVQDIKEARRWLSQAASQGLREAEDDVLVEPPAAVPGGSVTAGG